MPLAEDLKSRRGLTCAVVVAPTRSHRAELLRYIFLRVFGRGGDDVVLIVELRTPSLEEFECNDDLAMAFDFAYLYPDFYAIVKFRDPVPRGRSADDIRRCAIIFYMELRNATHLILDEWLIERGSGQAPDMSRLNRNYMAVKEMLNCLKYVKITNFYGNEGEMELVKCLVLNARALTEMRIVPPRKRVELGGEKLLDINAERWVKISEKLICIHICFAWEVAMEVVIADSLRSNVIDRECVCRLIEDIKSSPSKEINVSSGTVDQDLLAAHIRFMETFLVLSPTFSGDFHVWELVLCDCGGVYVWEKVWNLKFCFDSWEMLPLHPCKFKPNISLVTGRIVDITGRIVDMISIDLPNSQDLLITFRLNFATDSTTLFRTSVLQRMDTARDNWVN
ncbi:hypothetical protein RJ639_032639 [Escallonia herrerae]|uniref:FBD domain-containing protein n=1 Tax=Escallonia herrerae TaxID=1293975 RepID=A0AA88WWM8_9ASTE|nr:hypothetical protein RJ639_032639 [Escallonia herrerae]